MKDNKNLMSKCTDCKSEDLEEIDNSDNYAHDSSEWKELECQDCGCVFFSSSK